VSTDFTAEVDHVARLARLDLDAEEKECMAEQLESILEIARKIQALDTEGVEPTAHVVTLPAYLRDDQVIDSLPLNRVLQNAPRRQKGYFRVPRITGAELPEL